MSDQLLRVFNFEVELRSSTSGETLGNGGFQECTGLDIELDIQELQEGGRNDGVVRRLGRAKYQNIVLRRGMFYSSGGLDRQLWQWLQDLASGVRPVRRYDGFIRVIDGDDEVIATWSFVRGLPAKISGPQLNAKTGDIAIEELTIAHEGLKLEDA